MKKLFMLLALVLGVVSCQTEPEGFDVVVGGEQDVNITVSLPESTRGDSAQGFDLSTLSTSDYELRYILEIYLDGGDDNKKFRDVKYSDATTVSFPVRLAPDRVYTFTVWADLVKKDPNRAEGANADNYYVTSNGLKNITIDVDKWTPNVEARDAFYGKAMLTMEQSIADLPTIELTRPFAKVRVVATDYKDIDKFGIVPTNAVAEYFTSEMYTSFNAVEGKAFGNTKTKTHTFNYADVDPYEGTNGEQLTLFADYVLVPADGNIQFTLSVFDNTKGTNALIKTNSFNTAIPVEANKVTSIVGDVLTEGGNVSIKIDGALGQKETINYVDTAESLQEIINRAEDNKPTTIILGGNVVINNTTTRAESQYGLIIPANKVIILDLNGFTISQSKECANSYSMIENRGTLTIADSSEANTGKISFNDTGAGDPNFGWGVYTITNSSNLTVNGGTIENISTQNTPGHIVHMYCAIQQGSSNALTTINNGVISTPSYRSVRATNGEVVINGGKFEGQVWMQSDYNRTTLTINGGEFEPKGGDGSSIFITNTNENGTKLRINDGCFKTKIGCTYPEKNDIKGSIFGGTFTTDAKTNTNAALINDDYAWVEAENGLWTLGLKPTIAKIGEVEYKSLQKAFDAGGEVTLLCDINLAETVVLAEGRTATLDLNGKTIDVTYNESTSKHIYALDNYGTLTIKDSEGTGKIVARGIYNRDGAKLTINEAEVVGADWNGGACVWGYGTSELYLNNATLVGNTGCVSSEGYIEINGGTYTCYSSIDDNGTKISSPTYNIRAYNGLKITNGDFTSRHGVISIGGGEALLENGNYTIKFTAATTSNVVYIYGTANVDIKGGKYISDNSANKADSGAAVLVSGSNASLNIYDGEFVGMNGMVSGNATLYGGKYNTVWDYNHYDKLENLLAKGYKAEQDENGAWTVVVDPTEVTTVAELKNALVSDSFVVIGADIENETIKLPAELSNFTLSAAKGVTLKNVTISATDGNAYHYENLTFDGITFDNSRILLTGWRNGEEVIKNLTITNCVFKNLDDTTNTAPVHINKDAPEAVENFTFTNNVINGATGGSKSGVYAQITGNVVFANNVINNVSFRPYVIQITTDDAIADTFTVTGNTFSGSSVGRAQGLGNNAEGTDAVKLVVSGNIFKDITNNYQICYWNFNPATTTADLSKNYYDIDIEANPGKIHYNRAAASVEDLKVMGLYPFYTALNADGTIDLNSLKYAE